MNQSDIECIDKHFISTQVRQFQISYCVRSHGLLLLKLLSFPASPVPQGGTNLLESRLRAGLVSALVLLTVLSPNNSSRTAQTGWIKTSDCSLQFSDLF